MLTKTAKAVLSPLSDAVTALIVIISDSQISGTPTPDLTQLSKAVDAQIRNLVAVAGKITDQPNADPSLKVTMPPACKEVLDASALLISATGMLLADPVSNAGRQDLLEAVKGILQGTTHILDVHDDAEIKKILNATQLTRKIMEMIKNPDPKQDLIILIKRFVQSHVYALQLSTKRVKEILSGRLSLDLVDAIECLSQESNFYLTACKLVASHRGSEEAVSTLTTSQNRICKEFDRVEKIIACKDADDFYKKDEKVVNNRYFELRNLLLSEPMTKQLDRDAAETRKNVDLFVGDANEKINSDNGIIKQLSNPEVLAFPALVATQSAGFMDLLKETVNDPNYGDNAQKTNHNSRELIGAIDNCIGALEANLNRGVVEELISLLADMSDMENVGTTVGSLSDATSRADIDTVESVTGDFKVRSTKLGILVDHVLAGIPVANPTHGQILLLQNKANNAIPGVLSGSKMFQKFPEELTGQNLQNAIETYTDATKGLQKQLVSFEGTFSASALLDGANAAFLHHAKLLQDGLLKNKAAKAAMEANYTALAANQLLSIVEKEKDNSEDAVYSQALETELAALRKAVPHCTNRVNALLAHISTITSEEHAELEKIITDLAGSMSSAGKVVKGYKGADSSPELSPLSLYVDPPKLETIAEATVPELPPKISDEELKRLADEEQARLLAEAAQLQDEQLRGLANAIKELVIVNDEAPKILSKSEAEEDPLKAVGQELKVEASHWSAESNPIVICVNNIAQMFLELSTHHKALSTNVNPQSKKDFIKTAQDIMAETAKLIKAVNPLIASCADKRLVLQIQQTTARISTLGQTLKVIAAVKASSPRDTDKQSQLITNGQNLVASVKMVLRDAISCTLRLRGDAPADLVHFKKQIYRGNKGPQTVFDRPVAV